ncbi:hypothetical protein DFP72DRAFT_1176592 [Ephemerocybe angulata]|uniref:Uncharacterized protein n=1 Tax=Ephemerocybe angulata TaxID=980116 RepID=A0A8H6HDD9_9AGAR|nr:hypothetical protein DFP72DRAFT_1176592 [Tulosesus angulatus]
MQNDEELAVNVSNSTERQPETFVNLGQPPERHLEAEEPASLRTPSFPPPMCDDELDIWTNFEAGNFKIEMDDPEQARKKDMLAFERRVKEFNLWAGLDESLMHGGEAVDDIEIAEMYRDEEDDAEDLKDILEAAGLMPSDPNLLADLVHRESGLLPTGEPNTVPGWSPYPSKLHFLLDALDNMPRLRVSKGLMNVILWLLREVGVKDVPTASMFRKMQVSLRNNKGVKTVHWTSPKGNAYSFNNPVDIIGNDWRNPQVRPHIRRYPVLVKDGVVSEVWHGQKWQRDLDRHALSPMFDAGKRHYYIDEPARLADGELVIPVRWFEDEDREVWFEAWNIVWDESQAVATIVDDKVALLRATELRENMLDLVDRGELPDWSNTTIFAGHASRMPNPDRALADGEPLYTSFIDIFGDDVSGNRSKSWNKHWNIYMAHRNLPRQMLHQESHTHFISTSPHASVTEQFQGVKDVIESTHKNPIRVYDPLTNQHMRFKLQCFCEPGDNPAQSEASGHIGSSGNFPCRKCTVGGTKEGKTTNEGFEAFFQPGVPRSIDRTMAGVKEQIKVACNGVAAAVSKMQTETGVKDSYTQFWIEQLINWSRERQKRGDGRGLEVIQDELMSFVDAHPEAVYNPFLTLKYSDVTQDTPVEILHTILLGVVKYSWHGTHTTWKDTQKQLYAPRLQSTNTAGLSIPAIRAGYIMQYANSLIGRQFRILVQTNTFHVYDLLSSDKYQLVKSTGTLAALLWIPEIWNMEQYLSDVEVAVGNVLDSAALIDPSKITAKIKYHLLTHAVSDIKRFGPLIGVATECYESFNIIFRHCSILSNHLAPSRDIAYQLAKQETFKHVMTGGWWEEDHGQPQQAGPDLQRFVGKCEMLRRIFNLSGSKSNLSVGETTLAPIPQDKSEPSKRNTVRPTYRRRETEARDAIAYNIDLEDDDILWYKCKSVVAASGDECRIGSWVFARGINGRDSTAGIQIGRIVDILRTEHGKVTLTVVECFQVSRDLHPVFDMPILSKPFDEDSRIAIAAVQDYKDILFDFNVQHDCYTAKCAATGKRALKQERIDSGKIEEFIEHQPISRYVINTHAFHNAHRLRSVPTLREHLRPKPLYADREQHHREAVASLRSSRAAAAEEDESVPAPSLQPAKKKRKRAAAVAPQAAAQFLSSFPPSLGTQLNGM